MTADGRGSEGGHTTAGYHTVADRAGEEDNSVRGPFAGREALHKTVAIDPGWADRKACGVGSVHRAGAGVGRGCSTSRTGCWESGKTTSAYCSDKTARRWSSSGFARVCTSPTSEAGMWQEAPDRCNRRSVPS
jgi:hypothetical protein